MRRGLFLGFGVIVLVVVLAIGYRQFLLLPQLRDAVTRDMHDPASAQFRNERYTGPWLASEGMYCGEVNARNLLGAYTGFKPFSVFYGKAHIGSDGLCDLTSSPPFWWLRW